MAFSAWRIFLAFCSLYFLMRTLFSDCRSTTGLPLTYQSEQLQTKRFVRSDAQGQTKSYLRPPRQVSLSSSTEKIKDLPLNSTLQSSGENGTAGAGVASNITLYGIRVEWAEPEAEFTTEEDGVPVLLTGAKARFRLFGSGWTNDTALIMSDKSGIVGQICSHTRGDPASIKIDGKEKYTATIEIDVPPPTDQKSSTVFYFCHGKRGDEIFKHLNVEYYAKLVVRERKLSLWLQLVIIVVCLSFSSLFSGLNLGLLSLNRTDLKIISNTGTEEERRYAKTILPVRLHGNYLLCAILLGNVLVNSIFTILLDDLSSGLVAIIISTLAIVIFGEITPQAVCSRHGLAIGAKTIFVTKTVMFLTAPLAYPISKLLDWALGEEITNIYDRERLKELVKLTTEYNDLEKEEVNIISGALELKKKTVAEVMTKLEDVYMLSLDTVLDFETVTEIMKSGYSRIPVYEGRRNNITSLLFIKDLALIDPDDCTPLKTVCHFYQSHCYFVWAEETLDKVFKQFQEGCRGHMAFVHKVTTADSTDPYYETVGIVTLEDVIEELIQAEIVDETDVYTDNKSKQRRMGRIINQDYSKFAEKNENQRIHVSPQLTVATFQFLTSSVEAFKKDNISESVLMRLLKQDVIFHIKSRDRDKEAMKSDPDTYIYTHGKSADYFVLILEGRVEVTVGKESLLFESGPFTHFGSQALITNTAESPMNTNVQAEITGSLQSVNLEENQRFSFVPDYTVRAISEVFYLRVKRTFYLAAKKATLLERSKKVSNAGDHFENEVEKLIHNIKLEEMAGKCDYFESPEDTSIIPRHASFDGGSSVVTKECGSGVKSRPVTPSRTVKLEGTIQEQKPLLEITPTDNSNKTSAIS